MNKTKFSMNKQSGVVLVISLIMLLLLSLIALTGSEVTSLEEKMASNMRDKNLAFQAGESALRAAESTLNLAVLPAFNDLNGLYSLNSIASLLTDVTTVATWLSAASVVDYSGTLSHTAAATKYIIQRMPTVGGGGSSLDGSAFTASEYFRVTSMARGGTTSAIVVLQSIYKR